MSEISPADVEIYLSGGATNTDPNLSLGGVISSTPIHYLTNYSPATPIAGVTIVYLSGVISANNSLIDYDADTGNFRFAYNGVTFGASTPEPTSNGKLWIPAANVAYQAAIDIDLALLPSTGLHDTGTISRDLVGNTLFDKLLSLDSVNGDTSYRCIYIKNTHSSQSILACKPYRKFDTSGVDIIKLGHDPATGTNQVAQIVANKNTAPTGVTFSTTVNSSLSTDTGILAPGDFYPIWIERSIAAANSTSNSANKWQLALNISTPL